MRKLARMLDVWIASPLPGRQGSVADAIQGEEAAWTALCRDISHIRTNTRFSPRSNLQLFGLPCAGALGRMLKKKADEAEQRERARHEREQLETEARLAQFRARAMRDIGDLAATWLNRTPSAGRQDTARDGIESDRFRRCDRRAQSKSSRTRPRTRDVAAQAESRRGAGRLALSRYYDPALAALWMRSSRPELGGKLPSDFTCDDATRDRCASYLPKKRSRR